MLGRLFLAFTVFTLVEIAILVQVGQLIGLWPTLASVIVTAYLGAVLTRKEGTRVMTKIQKDLQAFRLPADAAVDGALILVAGAFLLTPGILTDAGGFLLLIPVTRAPFRRILKSWLAKRIKTSNIQMGFPMGPGGSVRREAVDITERKAEDVRVVQVEPPSSEPI